MEFCYNENCRWSKFVFCLLLIWCVCMIFSKISLVTSHGAFATRFDFTAGNTPCRKNNQSTTSIHSVPIVLVFRTAQIENTRLKCSGEFSLSNKCKKWNKLQTHTGVIIWYLFQTRNWLVHNAIWKKVLSKIWRLWGKWRSLHRRLIKYSTWYTGTLVTLSESFLAFRTNARFIQMQLSVLFYFKLPSHSLSAPYAPWQWYFTL